MDYFFILLASISIQNTRSEYYQQLSSLGFGRALMDNYNRNDPGRISYGTEPFKATNKEKIPRFFHNFISLLDNNRIFFKTLIADGSRIYLYITYQRATPDDFLRLDTDTLKKLADFNVSVGID